MKEKKSEKQSECIHCGSVDVSPDRSRNDSGIYPPEQQWWECNGCGEDWYVEIKLLTRKDER